MERQSSSFEKVYQRLQTFEKRYYLNHLMQRIAVFIAVSVILIFTLSLIELLFPNQPNVRATLFFTYLGLEVAGMIYMMAIPLLKVLGIGNVYNDEEIARIIGQREGEVSDKLRNILQLKRMSLAGESPLLREAIRQKSLDLEHVPFHLTAELKKGMDFLKLSAGVLAFVVLIAVMFPDIFNYGTRRIIYFSSDIRPPAPFDMKINRNDFAVRNEPYLIQIDISGEVIPKEVFLEINGKQYNAEKHNFNNFSYKIQNVKNPFSFRVNAEGFSTALEKVEVIDRPAIIGLKAKINYPVYLDKEDALLRNAGNLTIPEGSNVEWEINTTGGERLEFGFNGQFKTYKINDETFVFDSTFRRSVKYELSSAHSNGLFSDTVNYRVDVVPDRYPSVEVRSESDSLNTESVYYGRISDDYGISDFRFGYRIGNEDVKYESLNFNRSILSDDFIYAINWEEWHIPAGEKVEFFFEVWDNDGVNGRKFGRSRKLYHYVPDESALKEKRDEISGKVQSEMEKALEEAKKLNKDIDELQKELIDEKKMDWSDKKKIEDLIQRNSELKKSLADIEKKNKQRNKFDEQFRPSDELMEKREELQDLIQKVMDDEMLEKLRELEKMMEELGKEEMNDALEDMEMSNEQVEKELDRALELFKQLEFEQQLNEVLSDLEELENNQEALEEQTEEKEINADEASEKQEKLNEEFEDWNEEFKKLQEKNEALEQKQKLDDFSEERQETDESMKGAKESLQKNQKKKATEQQQKAGENMSEMKQGLMDLKSSMKEQASEDIQSLRATLENLIELSFEQEDLMEEMKDMRGDDPRFNDLTRKQRGIMDGMKIVEDSLNALGKRISQIKPSINREVSEAKSNMEKAIKNMTSRKMQNFRVNQQLAMTSVNNLALLLDEVVNQLQQQMMQSMGSCSKPGGKPKPKPGTGSMKQLQEQLNKQLEDMKKMMDQRQGKKPGVGKGGKDAEQLAKMAAEQAKIREMLRKMEQNANQDDAKGLQKIGDMMEETERDIVNRQITRQTLMRQENILTRLLESERSERERDKEEKREAQSGDEKKKSNLLDLKEYYKAKNTNHEDLLKESIGYNRYYKKKVEEYFKIIQ